MVIINELGKDGYFFTINTFVANDNIAITHGLIRMVPIAFNDCMNNNIPASSNVWQYCVIFPNCKIGENCNICSHCLIENDVEIGNNVTVKCGVQIWDGITLEDNVMVGSNVTFTNDMYPRSKNKDWKLLKTRVCKGATIGAGCVILPGITIG